MEMVNIKMLIKSPMKVNGRTTWHMASEVYMFQMKDSTMVSTSKEQGLATHLNWTLLESILDNLRTVKKQVRSFNISQ